jgi:calpain-7
MILFNYRFNKKIVTNCIFPQKAGQPIINPYGKYMVKLFINGVWRKIIIDDTLPFGSNGELICAQSVNADEMWISLLEKAYLKVKMK